MSEHVSNSEGENFVAPETGHNEKEGFVDPEVEQYHQDLKSEYRRLDKENVTIDKERRPNLDTLDSEMKKHEQGEMKLHEDLAELNRMEDEGRWYKGDEEYHKSVKEGVRNRIEQQLSKQREVSGRKSEVHQESAERRTTQAELQREIEIAEQGDSDKVA